MSFLESFVAGFALSGTLIVAIGAQNAFVLRQGFRREHVGAVVALCAASDALLMAVGIAAVGALGDRLPVAGPLLAWAGAAFLAAYGLRALWRAWRAPQALAAGAGGRVALPAVLAQAVAFTYLNPHVYLDTVWLVGSVGAQHAPALRPWFLAGGAAASAAWFVLLGYGARRMAPWLARPVAWRGLDALVGATMLVLAANLVRQQAGGL